MFYDLTADDDIVFLLVGSRIDRKERFFIVGDALLSGMCRHLVEVQFGIEDIYLYLEIWISMLQNFFE